MIGILQAMEAKKRAVILIVFLPLYRIFRRVTSQLFGEVKCNARHENNTMNIETPREEKQHVQPEHKYITKELEDMEPKAPSSDVRPQSEISLHADR